MPLYVHLFRRKIAQVPSGKNFLGWVVDALARPLDKKSTIVTEGSRLVELVAPVIIARKSVSEPVQRRINAIDAMITIERGQRELIMSLLNIP